MNDNSTNWWFPISGDPKSWFFVRGDKQSMVKLRHMGITVAMTNHAKWIKYSNAAIGGQHCTAL